jgi:hypothetical protein
LQANKQFKYRNHSSKAAEQVFAKLKHLLRKASARSIDAVCQAIDRILETLSPQKCLNYFQNSGYART